MTLTDTRHTHAVSDLAAFKARVDELVHSHPVVVDNRYTKWFATGVATRDEVRHLTVQFSVFSHLFVEAQLRKVINAADIDSYRAGKEILMNELGVVFNGQADADGISTEGTVDGSRYRHPAAHFEWLLRFARPLGLEFADLGKRRHGTPTSRFFCDELLRVYGSEDASTAEGASYAVENWAAAGFWKELISGLAAFKERECPELHLGFWTWHDRVEDQHAAHTADELAEAYFTEGFDEDRFLAGAREMLDGVQAFWDGLDRDRRGAAVPEGVGGAGPVDEAAVRGGVVAGAVGPAGGVGARGAGAGLAGGAAGIEAEVGR